MSTTAAQTCALKSAHRHRDAELAERVGAGDLAAFAVLDERHRAALVRYAASLLRRSEHDAEDVVQEVLIGLYVALRAGDVPDDLRTWLFRLTHNRAINVVRRARWGDAPLDPQTFAERAGGDEPYAALRRSESLQELLGDLADLPEQPARRVVEPARGGLAGGDHAVEEGHPPAGDGQGHDGDRQAGHQAHQHVRFHSSSKSSQAAAAPHTVPLRPA